MSNKETFLGKNFHEKKGQVTIFIIVGILIVIIVGGLIFVNRDKISFRGVTSTQVEPVREYIRGCVENRLEIKLNEMKSLGGRNSLDHQAPNPFFNLNILIDDDGNNFAETSPDNLRRYIEEDIERYIINGGCSLNDFRTSFEITENYDNVNVNALISDDFVRLTLYYSVKLKKGDIENLIDRFDISFETNFGELFFVVRDVANGLSSPITITDLFYYCANIPNKGGRIKCLIDDSRANGFQLVGLGNSEDFPEDETEFGNSEDLFLFVVAT